MTARFVRFAPATARAFAHRFLEAGFVPRGGDSFALHDVERAANFVREVVGDWDDVDIVLDDSLSAVAAGESAIDVSISARQTDVEGERDWFELNVDVFVGDGDRAHAERTYGTLVIERPLRRSPWQALRRRRTAETPYACSQN